MIDKFLNENVKAGIKAKQAFRDSANPRIRKLPKKAREDCKAIDAHAAKVMQKWKIRQKRRFNTEVNKVLIKKQNLGNAPSPAPRGMKNTNTLNIVSSRAIVKKRNEGQMKSLDNARKDRRNAVAQDHGVHLHTSRSLSHKGQFNTAAKGLSR